MQNNLETWPFCEPTGSLISFERKQTIPPFLKDIGLGASLYLLILKTLSFYFFFLSLLNLPVMILYAGSIGEDNLLGSLGVRSIINLFQISNIGHRNFICREVDLDQSLSSVDLKCSVGKLSNIVGLGINSN